MSRKLKVSAYRLNPNPKPSPRDDCVSVFSCTPLIMRRSITKSVYFHTSSLFENICLVIRPNLHLEIARMYLVVAEGILSEIRQRRQSQILVI